MTCCCTPRVWRATRRTRGALSNSTPIRAWKGTAPPATSSSGIACWRTTRAGIGRRGSSFAKRCCAITSRGRARCPSLADRSRGFGRGGYTRCVRRGTTEPGGQAAVGASHTRTAPSRVPRIQPGESLILALDKVLEPHLDPVPGPRRGADQIVLVLPRYGPAQAGVVGGRTGNAPIGKVVRDVIADDAVARVTDPEDVPDIREHPDDPEKGQSSLGGSSRC